MRFILSIGLVLPLVVACESGDDDILPPDPAPSPETVEFSLDGVARSIARIPNGPAPELPVGALERTIDLDGEQIFSIEIPGTEPPIVLMHGFPDNIGLYERLYPELAGRRVIAFDFVGWGRSSKPLPGGSYPYTFAQQARELETVLDTYGVASAVLVVHDSSGPPGIDFSLAQPERIERLILLNTFYGRAEGALVAPKGVELHSDPRLEGAERAVQSEASAIESYYRFQMDEFIVSADGEEEFIDGLWALYAEARPAFVSITNSLSLEVGQRSVDENSTLNQLVVPVDIVFGVDDPYLNPSVARHFEANIPDVTLHLLDNAGHFVQVDAPEEVARVILSDR